MVAQEVVYFVKGACEEELNLQGRGGEPDVWLDSFDDVTPCVVQEVGTTSSIGALFFPNPSLCCT